MADRRERIRRRKALESREPFFKIDVKGLIRLGIIAGVIIAGILILSNAVAQSNVAGSYMSKAETIKVGVRTDVKGFGEVDANGTIQGFDADVASEAIVRVFGKDKPVSFVALSSEDAGAGIKYGQIDVALGFLAAKTERVSGYLVTDPYYTDKIVAVSAGAGIAASVQNLDQKDVGVLSSLISSSQADDSLKSKNVTAQIIKYYGFEDAKLDLDKNKINAFLAPQALAKQYMSGYITLGDPLGTIGYSIMLPASEGAVQGAMTNAIHAMQSDGTVANLAVKWGIPYGK